MNYDPNLNRLLLFKESLNIGHRIENSKFQFVRIEILMLISYSKVPMSPVNDAELYLSNSTVYCLLNDINVSVLFNTIISF